MKFLNALDRVVLYVEGAVAALLAVMAALGAVDVVVAMVDLWGDKGFLTPEAINSVLDTVLVVFIVVELFRIAVAYMQHRNVIPTVLEAGLVAVARKLVVFEGGTGALEKAAQLAMLTLAVGITWFLLRKAGVCEGFDHKEHVPAVSEGE